MDALMPQGSSEEGCWEVVGKSTLEMAQVR